MTSDVVLTAALRSNLLSLQNTQRQIDVTQNRLATGRKVNSALDNPQSFFAAQALTNRASDLTRLLDSIGQSIQVIKAADNGITALTKLVEQAESVATSARDALSSGQAEAKVVGDVDLSGENALDDLPGFTAAGGDQLIFTVTQDDGTAINIGAYNGAAAATATITLANNGSIDDLINQINDLHFQVNGAGNAVGDQAIEASLDDEGHLQIRTLNGGNFNLNFVSATANADVNNLGLANALGFGDVARVVRDAGAGTNNVEFSSIADVALRSYSLYDNTGTKSLATRADLITTLETETSATDLFQNIGSANDVYQIGVNGGTLQDVNLFQNGGVITIQEFIDQINNNATLNTLIQADFDDETGQVIISAIDSTVKSIEIGLEDNNETATANFGFGVNADITNTATDNEIETIQLASAAGELAQFESDYNNLLEQIDLLVSDTGYRGTNLLNGDNLLTNFNEDRTSSLTTEGATFTSSGLGLSEGDFSRTTAVDASLEEVRAALSSVRNFGASLADRKSVV